MSTIQRYNNIRSSYFEPIADALSSYAAIPEVEIEFRLKRQPILIEQYHRGIEWASKQTNMSLHYESKTLDINLQQSQHKANPKDSFRNLRFTLTGSQIAEYCRTDRIPVSSNLLYKRLISKDMPYRDIFDIRCSASIELEMSKEKVSFSPNGFTEEEVNIVETPINIETITSQSEIYEHYAQISYEPLSVIETEDIQPKSDTLVEEELKRSELYEKVIDEIQKLIPQLKRHEVKRMMLMNLFHQLSEKTSDEPVFVNSSSHIAIERYLKSKNVILDYKKLVDKTNRIITDYREKLRQTSFTNSIKDTSVTIENGKIVFKGKSYDDIGKLAESNPEKKQFALALQIRHNYLDLNTHDIVREYEKMGFARGDAMEAFSSAFSHYFDRYCSIFPDLEAPFGSQGSFFTQTFDDIGLVMVDPPIDAGIISKTIQFIKNANAESTKFVITLPNWSEFPEIDDLKKNRQTTAIYMYPKGMLPFVDYKGEHVFPGEMVEIIVDKSVQSVKETKEKKEEDVQQDTYADANRQWNRLLSEMKMTNDTFQWSAFYSHDLLRESYKTYRLKHRHRYEYKPENSNLYDTFYMDFTRVKSSKKVLSDDGMEYSYPVKDFIDSEIASQPESYEIEIEIESTSPQKTANTIRDYVYRIYYMELLPSMLQSPATTLYSNAEEELVRSIYTRCMRRGVMVIVSKFFTNLIERLNKSIDKQKKITEELRDVYIKSAMSDIGNQLDIDLDSSVLSKEIDTLIGYGISKNVSMLERKIRHYKSNITAIQKQNKFSEFVSPKVVSIQMEHIIPSNIQSIQYNYTVTDKADGIGCLMFSIGNDIWQSIIGASNTYNIDSVINYKIADIRKSQTGEYRVLMEELLKTTYHMVDSNLQIYPTFLLQNKNSELATFNLLNGEYMPNKTRDVEIDQTVVGFMGIYDCYVYQNKFVMYSPLMPSRFENARHAVNHMNTAMDSLVRQFKNNKIQWYDTQYMKVFMKQFYNTHVGFDIFQASAKIWDNYRQGKLVNGLSYHLDGLIYTPADLPVGHNQLSTSQICMISYGNTWTMNLKWKPPQDNTIDFYIQFEKQSLVSYNNKHVWIDRIYEKVVQDGASSKTIRYKKARLYNGGKVGESEATVPIEFRPENEKESTNGNYEIHLPVKLDSYTGKEECYSEDGKRIENESIVEVGYNYNPAIPYDSRWFVLRTRYDKTLGYKKGIHERETIFRSLQSKYKSADDIPVSINYGNHTNVAHNIWKTIYSPITEEMICTGTKIPEMSDADIVYYEDGAKKAKDKSLTESLQKFHNFVKGHVLLRNAVMYCKKKFGDEPLRLIDFTCGKGGDIHKWNELGISYVMGVDLFSNNIHDKEDGAIRRYSELVESNQRMQKKTFDADFLVGDSSVNWSTDAKRAFPNEKDWRTYTTRMATGQKFHIATVMFSLHYFFKNEESLRNILSNISSHLEKGGIVVGICFDGESVHRLFKDQTDYRPQMYEINGRTVCMIVPDYLKKKTKLGKTGEMISVYNYSINKIFPEYLVFRKDLVESMKSHQMHEINTDELTSTEIPESYRYQPQLSDELVTMYETVKQRKLILDNTEKSISFLNQYFFFINDGGKSTVAKKKISESAKKSITDHHTKIVANISKYDFDDPTSNNFIFDLKEKDGTTPKYLKYQNSIITFLERYDKDPYITDDTLSVLINEVRYWKKQLEKNPYE
jgi:hypothetical protein